MFPQTYLPLFYSLLHHLRRIHCGGDLVVGVADGKCLQSSPQFVSITRSASMYEKFVDLLHADFEQELTTAVCPRHRFSNFSDY